MNNIKENILGVVLAGGESRRMGHNDKALLDLHGRPLIRHVISKIEKQVDQTVVNANDDITRFAFLGLETIRDTRQPPRGPLEGILAALQYMQTYSLPHQWLLSVPNDCPFLPEHLAEHLWTSVQTQKSLVSIASYQDQLHYTCALWSRSLLAPLHKYLDDSIEGRYRYSIRGFLNQLNHSVCTFDYSLEAERHSPFFNINTEEDLQRAKEIINT